MVQTKLELSQIYFFLCNCSENSSKPFDSDDQFNELVVVVVLRFKFNQEETKKC